MDMENLISTTEFCVNHQIEISFISSLQQYGLIEIITVQENTFIDSNELHKLEKFLRLYYDMDINLEGIEAITNILQRVNDMQDEITELKNRLRLYEDI